MFLYILGPSNTSTVNFSLDYFGYSKEETEFVLESNHGGRILQRIVSENSRCTELARKHHVAQHGSDRTFPTPHRCLVVTDEHGGGVKDIAMNGRFYGIDMVLFTDHLDRTVASQADMVLVTDHGLVNRELHNMYTAPYMTFQELKHRVGKKPFLMDRRTSNMVKITKVTIADNEDLEHLTRYHENHRERINIQSRL